MPHQFFTGKQACIFIYAPHLQNACICAHFGLLEIAVNTTTEEVLIILGNNLLHAAKTRARQALPYRARARMLWHFLSTTWCRVIEYKQHRLAFECQWDVASLLTINVLDIRAQKKCDWQPDTLNSLINLFYLWQTHITKKRSVHHWKETLCIMQTVI